MNPQKQELLEKLKGANNILVTVSANPSVDQLAACIGVTLLLNKLKKHATAVFSGEVPSTIEFLKPEETLEKNTDSLRDFIISLDKSKADKLRYKVEDQVVRIFITPYKTSISQDDLDFGQGDFNVDVVLCLGVNQQQDLDQAITTHGRILHDAVVVSINTQAGGELGAINWTDPAASSLSELVAGMADALGKQLLDGQIATAILTGIVAETARFSNEKTSPETMRLSAELMAAGANQQLVATELEAPEQPPEETPPADNGDQPEPPASDAPGSDGTIEISHPASETAENFELPEPKDNAELPENPDFPGVALPADVPDDSQPPAGPPAADEPEEPAEQTPPPASRLMLQPPSLGGTLTANTVPEEDILRDPLSVKPSGDEQPMLDHSAFGADEKQAEVEPVMPATNAVDKLVPSEPIPETPVAEPATPELKLLDEPTLPPSTPPQDNQIQINDDGTLKLPSAQPTDSDDAKEPETLSDLEVAVQSPHVTDDTSPPGDDATDQPAGGVDAARDAVQDALNAGTPSGPIPPTQASGATGYLNVQDLPDINDDGVTAPPAADLTEAAAAEPVALPTVEPLPAPESPKPPAADSEANSSDAPPPVPPPLPLSDLSKFMPPSGQ